MLFPRQDCNTETETDRLSAPCCLRVMQGTTAMMEMSLSGVMAQPIGWHLLAHVNCPLIVCHMKSVIQAAEKFDQRDIIKIWRQLQRGGAEQTHVFTLRSRCGNVLCALIKSKRRMMQSRHINIQTDTTHMQMWSHTHSVKLPVSCSSALSHSNSVSVEFKCHSGVHFPPETAGTLRNGQFKQMKWAFNPQFSERQTERRRERQWSVQPS